MILEITVLLKENARQKSSSELIAGIAEKLRTKPGVSLQSVRLKAVTRSKGKLTVKYECLSPLVDATGKGPSSKDSDDEDEDTAGSDFEGF